MERVRIILAGLAFAMAVLPARAGFRLVRDEARAAHTISADGFRATVDFTIRELSDDPLDTPTESFLLATPGISDGAIWSVSAVVEAFEDGTSPAGADAAPALEWRHVQMGTLEALQVIVAPDRVRDAAGAERRASRLRVEVGGPAPSPQRAGIPSAPISDFPAVERLARTAFLNADELRTVPLSSSAASARGFDLPNPPGPLRIRYAGGDEILRVPLADLGIDEFEIPSIRLDHHGDTLTAGGTALGGDLWFYAPRRHTLQDTDDSVFVDFPFERAALAVIPERAAFDQLTPQGTEVAIPRRRRFEENNRYQRNLPAPVQTRFVYYQAGSGTTSTIELRLDDIITSDTFQVTAEIYGLTAVPAFPDHFMTIGLNGVQAPQSAWEGRQLFTFSRPFTLPEIPSTPTLTFSHEIPSGSPFDGIGLDLQNLSTIEIAWEGKPRVEGGARGLLEVADTTTTPTVRGAPAFQRVTLGGFPLGTTADDLILLDITNPTMPVRIVDAPTFADESGGTAIEFEVRPEGGVFFTQLISDIAAADEVVAAATLPADLPSGVPLRGIFVRPASLAASLAPLVAHRGEGFVELDTQAAYDAYNGGQKSAEAIRLALRDMVVNVPLRDPLPAVVLVGHGSLDARDYLGFLGDRPVVPFYVGEGDEAATTSFEFIADADYERLIGSDPFADIALGRFPVRSSAELDIVVARQIQHDDAVSSLTALNRPGVFIADDQDGGIFINDQPTWIEPWETTGHAAIEVNVPLDDAQVPATRQLVADVLSGAPASGAEPSGAALAMYVGHGSRDRWGNERIIDTTNILAIDTAGKWPFAAVYNCLNGDFGHPGAATSLSEAWLVTTDPGDPSIPWGGIGMIAPSGVDFYFEQRQLAVAAFDLLERGPLSAPRHAGELLARSRTQYLMTYPTFERTAREFLLFGDPLANLTIFPPLMIDTEAFFLY